MSLETLEPGLETGSEGEKEEAGLRVQAEALLPCGSHEGVQTPDLHNRVSMIRFALYKITVATMWRTSWRCGGWQLERTVRRREKHSRWEGQGPIVGSGNGDGKKGKEGRCQEGRNLGWKIKLDSSHSFTAISPWDLRQVLAFQDPVSQFVR